MKTTTAQRALSRASSFGDTVRDFASSAGPKFDKLADMYTLPEGGEPIGLLLLRKSTPDLSRHNLINLIKSPPDDVATLGLDASDRRIVEYARDLELPFLRDGLAAAAEYLAGLKPSQPNYRELEAKFTVAKAKPQAPPKQEAPKKPSAALKGANEDLADLM